MTRVTDWRMPAPVRWALAHHVHAARAAQVERFAILVLLCLLTPTLSLAAQNSTCISDRQIESRDVPDDSTIIFHLRGGQVWKNALLTRCFGLKSEPDGFTYQPTDPSTEELCSNQVTIRLNSFHSVCQLGNFTRLK